jgi:16S rRNA (cytosine1402-N4)-methyltransferase
VHKPVLYQEVLTYLQPRSGQKYIDCTVGTGGHARGILSASDPDGLLLGMDLDSTALSIARETLHEFEGRFTLVHASYTTLLDQMRMLGWDSVDGILLDLGVSSLQLDIAEKGFSFRVDAPLDMRFDPSSELTAADLVNHLEEEELAQILFRYGEERFARQIARAIVHSRPITTTGQLAEIISKTIGERKQAIHPATRTFQALRIAVNRELEAVEQVLPQIIEALAPKGRVVVIAFHSLEDRLIKEFFRRESHDCICPPRQPVCTCGHKASLRLITPKAIKPSAQEIQLNPRARSARLRVAEKIERTH